MLQYFTL